MNPAPSKSLFGWCAFAALIGWCVGYYGPRPVSTAPGGGNQILARRPQAFTQTHSLPVPPHPSTTPASGNTGSLVPAISLFSLPEAERAEDLELVQRQDQGDYVLETDHNLHRKRIRQIVSNLVQTATQQVTPRYTAKLAELGIDPAASAQVIQHLAKVREASLLVEDPLRQLANARQDLDKRLTSMLSPEAYQEFKRFEEAQRGRRDLEQISAVFESSTGARLSTERETVLLELMHQTGAYSEPAQHGLYDGLPATATGRQAVKELMTSVLTNLEQTYPRLMAQAQQAGFSAAELQILRTHYEQRLASQRSSLERLQRPDMEDSHPRSR